MKEEITSIIFRWVVALLLVIFSDLFYVFFKYPTIWLSSLLIKIFNSGALVRGDTLFVGNMVIEFIRACIAPSAYVLLAVLLLLTPGFTVKKYFNLFVIGAAILFLLNSLRIFILIEVLLVQGVNYFNALHLFFWLFLSSVLVALVWIYLVFKFKIRNVPVYDDLVSVYKSLNKRKK